MSSLSLIQTYTAVRNIGLSVPFGATGGTAPYMFAVAPGGAGGTIGSSSGLYVSPIGSTGIDVITVTDASASSVSGSILVGTPIELVCDIVRNQLALANDQVWLWQQKVNIPSDSRSYVVVGIQSNKFFGNKPDYQGGSASFVAVQSVNVQQKLTLDIFSRSLAPSTGIELIELALASPYAEQQMELNSFFVAPLSESVINIGVIDGAAIPYHFQMRANLQFASTLQSSPSYFSSFSSPTVVVESPVSVLQSIDVIPYGSSVALGSQIQMTAVARYSLGQMVNVTDSADWSISGGSGIASVGSTGLVTGISSGTISVVAALSDVSGSAPLSVVYSFSPTDIAGLTLWMDGADKSTMALSGNLISSWVDKSSNAQNFVANGSARPTYTANSLNSNSGVAFNGSSTNMSGNATSLFTYNSGGYSAFFVCTLNSFASANTFPGLLVALNNGSPIHFGFSNDVADSYNYFSFGGASTGNAGRTLLDASVTGTPHLIKFVNNGGNATNIANYTITDNGSPSTVLAAGGWNSPVSDNLIGNWNLNASTGFWNGLIYEMIVYNTQLSSGDQATVSSYLSSKWGIAL